VNGQTTEDEQMQEGDQRKSVSVSCRTLLYLRPQV